MVRLLVFNVLYLVCVLFALRRGGAPERIGAIILIADFQLSLWVVQPMTSRFIGIEWSMLAVDALAFIAFYLLSLATTRFWPCWMAALQGCTVLSHSSGLRPAILPWAYGTAVAAWAYVMLVLLASAAWRHRTRLGRYDMDPAWSWQLPSTYRSGASYEPRSLGNPRHKPE